MTIHPVPKPEPRVKKPRKRLQSKARLQAKTPLKKQNQTRMHKRRGSYQKYMRSPAWKRRRIVALIRANYTCERCGYVQSDSVDFFLADLIDDRDLHVHHKTYARLGHELDTDLEVLCNVCHEKEHASRAIKPRFLRAS